MKTPHHTITVKLSMHTEIIDLAMDQTTIYKPGTGTPTYSTATGTLKTASGTILNGEKVTVYIYLPGSPDWSSEGVEAIQTGGTFSAQLPSSLADVGTYAMKAVFTGHDGYLTCESIIGPPALNVVPEYIFGGLAALGACFVGFLVFKKRSSLPQLRFK